MTDAAPAPAGPGLAVRAISRSREETIELAARVAGVAEPGDILLVVGELGVGKTVFAKGFARGLGVDGPVTSPTFTLVSIHPCSSGGVTSFVHADLYRLDSLAEVADLAIPELADDGGVALVEWGDVAAGLLPRDYLLVQMGGTDAQDSRILELNTVGASWERRARRLAEAASRWRVDRRVE